MSFFDRFNRREEPFFDRFKNLTEPESNRRDRARKAKLDHQRFEKSVKSALKRYQPLVSDVVDQFMKALRWDGDPPNGHLTDVESVSAIKSRRDSNYRISILVNGSSRQFGVDAWRYNKGAAIRLYEKRIALSDFSKEKLAYMLEEAYKSTPEGKTAP